MKITKRPDPEPLHAAATALRVWLLDVCVWLAARLGVRLPRAVRMDMRRELARALRDARMLVFLLAVSRMHIPVVAPRATRPPSAPPGFRRARVTGADGRVFGRGLRLKARALAGKLAELRAVFDNLGAAARRMLRHLRRRVGGVALVLAVAIADIAVDMAMVTPAAADTS